MFANLVESNSHKGDYARRGKFFLVTLTIYALAFLAIGVGSIYAYNIQVDSQNLELTSLVTPIDTSEVQMLRVRPAERPAAGPSSSSSPRVAVVKSPPTMVTSDSRVIPHGVSISTPVPELPRGTDFRVGIPKPGENFLGAPGNGTGNRAGGGGTGGGSGMDELVRDTPPPPMKVDTPPPPTHK
ncbi:MAG TPA: hypothetical protein VEV81_15030, partial [Pyrinomonadaceae bacterium]|nr:hypothetical protein [Pyrinomonadaceae bacterium]